MKLLTTLLFLFASSLCDAQESKAMTRYYHYDGKPIFLREASFKRYVLPQVKGMVRDWERLLVRINPLHEDLVSLRTIEDKLSMAWEKASIVCRKGSSQKCDEQYRKAYALGRKIDLTGLNFGEKRIRLDSPKKGMELDRMMTLLVNLEKVLKANYFILHYLEEELLFGGGRKGHERLAPVLDPLVKDLKFFSNIAMTGFLLEEEKIMFDFVWDNFFSPLDIYVVKKRDKKYLLRHLEELNIAWHTFHMKLTKGFKKYPKSVEILFITMSKRWNSILKIILHTTKPDSR